MYSAGREAEFMAHNHDHDEDEWFVVCVSAEIPRLQ